MKKVSYFLVALGAALFITISGCQKDKSNLEGSGSGSSKNSSVSALPNSKQTLSTSKDCWSTFNNDVDSGVEVFKAGKKYNGCVINAFDDLSKPVGSPKQTYPAPLRLKPHKIYTYDDLFDAVTKETGITYVKDNPESVKKVGVYILPYISIINGAAAKFKNGGSHYTAEEKNIWIEIRYTLHNSTSKYISYPNIIDTILSIHEMATMSSSHEMTNDPLWTQLSLCTIDVYAYADGVGLNIP